MSTKQGGKAKPLKQPKAEKKEYDECGRQSGSSSPGVGSSTPGVSTPSSINLGDDDPPADYEEEHDTCLAGRKAAKKRKNKNTSLVSLQKDLIKKIQDLTEQGRMFAEAGIEREQLRLKVSMEKERTKQLEIQSILEKERTKQLEIKTKERMADMEFERYIMSRDPSKAATEMAKAWIIAQQNAIINKLTQD